MLACCDLDDADARDERGVRDADGVPAPVSVARAPAVSASVAWNRVLLMVLRRYAGRLAVRGKLLNQEELLVAQLCRLDGATRTAAGRDDADPLRQIDPSVYISATLGLRFVMRCEDGPIDRVGCDDVVARVEPGALAGNIRAGDADVVAVVVQADERIASPVLWEQPLALAELHTLYGFDVRFLLELASRASLSSNGSSATAACIARMTDEYEDCTNAVIARTFAFRDLRGTQMLMQRMGLLQGQQQQQQQRGGDGNSEESTTAPLCSLFMGARCRVSAAHPRSYVSLAFAQKRAWSRERVAYGRELMAKARVKDAIAEFSSALELDAAHTDALFARSEAHAALQQFADAVRDLEALRVLDAAYPQLDAALARARSKLRHSQRVDMGSSLPAHRLPPAIAPAKRSPLMSSREPKPLRDAPDARRSIEPAQSLESQRLRRLLEAEVAASARVKRDRRKYSAARSGGDNSSSDSDSSDSESDARRKRRSKKHKKAKHKKAKHKRRRRHEDSDSETSRRHRRRHRHSRRRGDASDASSESARRSRSRSRSRSARRVKHSRRGPSVSPVSQQPLPPPEDAPHPILARQRHRIWN